MGAASNGCRLTVWGAGTARTLRVHWAMAELGLDYACKAIGPRTGETKTAEFTALTARQKIPLLEDGEFVITESGAIISYLSDTYASDETALVPRTPRARSCCLEWCFFALTELDAASLYVIRRHRELAHIYGEAPEVCRAAGEYFCQQMRSVERALGDGRPFIAGDTFSAADILLTSCLNWADRVSVDLPAFAEAYRARMCARPGFARAMARNIPQSS